MTTSFVEDELKVQFTEEAVESHVDPTGSHLDPNYSKDRAEINRYRPSLEGVLIKLRIISPEKFTKLTSHINDVSDNETYEELLIMTLTKQ